MSNDPELTGVTTQRTIEIGNRLRESRAARGLTLQQVSTLSGGTLGKSRISNYEQGLRRPSLEAAEHLAALLGVEVVWLLGIPA